ncbi:DUF58 domain-containing protein [Nocardioides sp. LS1]|uniref:DUF58 domain-containing protein n=1 Tax=Nocardioides sp. LS1 TaxID=1027620 RepID=UPI000F624AA8|nr:DUF58 domain-containing protein [Nocardioides sp. LS1]GCD91588.1 hypothetical protein NLS1_35940 [Nocardioides sp. LS1]
MTGWRVSAALSRALSLAGIGLASAVLFGEPALMVMTAPFLVFGALGLLGRPSAVPRFDSRLDHSVLHEGQGTRSRLTLEHPAALESVTRVVSGVPYVAVRPAGGMVARRVSADERELAVLEVSPRRWGRRPLGNEHVMVTSSWAGYRLGPVEVVGGQLEVLPVRAPFDSRAEAPQPIGLVGAHRSRRLGDGSEFASIRPFHAGDRLRRINWRVSLRTGDLHVVTARGEEDAGVLLLLDALADHGISRGVDGPASSLDVSVRAAAALAEHYVRTGDRVGLRVVGGTGASITAAAGRGHLRRIQSRLAQLYAAEPRVLSSERFQLGVAPGTVVIVLSPMLTDLMGTITGMLVRRGLPVLVIDTLPGELAPSVIEGTDPVIADLAWRMRLLEREEVLARLSSMGCPVVPWSGPGTLDDVLRRLARRSQLPQVRAR